MEWSPHACKQGKMAIESRGRKQQSNVESGQVVIHRTYTAHSTSVLCFQRWRQQVEYVVIHVAAKEARWRGLCDQMCHEKDAKNHSVTPMPYFTIHIFGLWLVGSWWFCFPGHLWHAILLCFIWTVLLQAVRATAIETSTFG